MSMLVKRLLMPTTVVSHLRLSVTLEGDLEEFQISAVERLKGKI